MRRSQFSIVPIRHDFDYQREIVPYHNILVRTILYTSYQYSIILTHLPMKLHFLKINPNNIHKIT